MGRIRVVILLFVFTSSQTLAKQVDRLPENSIRAKDTIVFDYAGVNLSIVDFDSVDNRFLGVDTGSRLVLEFNAIGELIFKKKFLDIYKKGSRFKSIFTLAYIGNGKKVVEGTKGYFYYDRNWNVTDSLIITNNFRYNDYPISFSRKAIMGRDGHIWENRSGFIPFKEYYENYFRTSLLVRTINPSSGRTIDAVGFPSASSFLKKQQLYQEHVPLLANGFNRQQLYMIFYMDPILYEVDPIIKEITKTVPLNLREFKDNFGIDLDKQLENQNPAFGVDERLLINMFYDSRILNIITHQNGYIVFYFPGFDPLQKDNIESFSEAQSKRMKESNQVMAFFSKNHLPLGEMRSPAELDIGSGLVRISSNSFIAKKRNADNYSNSKDKWTFLVYQIY